MRISGLLGAFVILLTIPGCFGCDSGPGDDAIGYDYDRCTGANCTVTANKLAVGTTATIDVHLSAQAGAIARVTSSDKSVATVVGHPIVGNILSVDVTAVGAGVTTLELVNLHGGSGGEVVVEVVAASLLQAAVGSLASDGRLALLGDDVATLDVTPFDAQGNALVGNVPVVISGANTVTTTALGRYAIQLVDQGPATLSGAIAGGPSFSLALRGDSLADLVAANAVVTPAGTDSYDAASFAVTVTPEDALGAVYGPTCVWQLDDASVTMTRQIPTTVAAPAGDDVLFALPAGVASATATCQIGALSTTISLQR